MKNPTYYLLSLVCLFCLSSLKEIQAANLPPGFSEILLAEGLDPTAYTFTPDGRIFLLEKTGKVRVVENGVLLPDPLLVIAVDNFNERGLGGIAIDPEFVENGHFYLYYTVLDSGFNRVSRFTASGNFASPSSEEILINLDRLPGFVHNAGSMIFGPDGKLYIGVGEGSQSELAQSLESLLGKILRLNRDGSIPEDNPFYNSLSERFRAIYAYGLRNPFNISLNPQTGQIFAADVGAATWEEINEILPGRNYGWPLVEGKIVDQVAPDNYKDPLYSYSHQEGCAIMGGTFYLPEFSLFPQSYQGKFFFADYCSGTMKYLDPANPEDAQIFATGINRPLSIKTAPDGTLYYLARAGIGGGSNEDNTSSDNGTLWQVVYTGAGTPFISVQPANALISDGESWEFHIRASGADTLAYQWQQNGVDLLGKNSENLVLEGMTLADSGSIYRCIVSNSLGSILSKEAKLSVTSNKRPNPSILLPDSGLHYHAGDQIVFEGAAEDPETGILRNTALRWKIDFHHLDHTHPALTPIEGISSGFYDIPQIGETDYRVWYRISLTATDPFGLSNTVYRDILPLISEIRINSVPSGLPFYTESSFNHTPDTVKSVSGIRREIRALSLIRREDSVFVFNRWSDGAVNPERVIITPEAALELTALYKAYRAGSGDGLTAQYFNGVQDSEEFPESPVFTRIDTTISFDWKLGSPKPDQINADHFLVRWEGFVQPPASGLYTFYLTSDDGARIWLNGELVAEKWIEQASTEISFQDSLEGLHVYPIKIEYFESTGNALCQLEWSSGDIPRSIIPRSQLYSIEPSDTSGPQTLSLNLFPNPSARWFNLELINQQASQVEIELISLDGKKVRKESLPVLAGKSTSTFDLQGLPAGIYWFRVLNSVGEQQFWKVILQ